jgi:hypothetical protein
LTLAFLFLYSPLRNKHLVMLLPIMAMLAGVGLSHLLRRDWPRWPAASAWRWQPALGGLLLLLLLFNLAQPYQALAEPRQRMIGEAMQPLLDMLAQHTSPTDCLITDSPYLPLVSNRLPPPWFSALSYARFASGTLDKPAMVTITESQGCQVVAPILERIKNANRPYYDWAKAHYLRVWVVDGKEIMLGKPLHQAQPQRPVVATFADQVELVGADWRPGQSAGHLSLYWRTLRPFTTDYKIFVQLRNEAGQTVASADHEAFAGLLPTSRWPVEAIFKDTNRLVWPADLPPGRYSLYVGLYEPASLARLPISGDTSGENAVVIPDLGLD